MILPAMLFRKFGVPHATICRIIATEKRGLRKRSCIFPLANAASAVRAQVLMPRHVARAAPQIPHRNIARKVNSNPALSTDITMFNIMLERTFPQILR